MLRINVKSIRERIDSITQRLEILVADKIVLEMKIAEKRRTLAELKEEQQKIRPLTKTMKKYVADLRNGWILRKSTFGFSSFYMTHSQGFTVNLPKTVVKGLLERKIIERGNSISFSGETEEYPLTDWGKSINLGAGFEEEKNL